MQGIVLIRIGPALLGKESLTIIMCFQLMKRVTACVYLL